MPGVPADHPSWLRFTAWLEEQQAKYEFVVLETDRQASGWTHRALGQADHVVIAGNAATDRSLGEIEERLLVDGGVVNNLPGDVMRNKCGGGPVIAVNVSPEEEVGIGADGFPSPWKIFWSRMLPFRTRITVPGMLDILMRTTMLASANRTAQVKNSVDLYLRPPIDGFGMLEFEKMSELVEVGYRYTLKTAAGWKPPKS